MNGKDGQVVNIANQAGQNLSAIIDSYLHVALYKASKLDDLQLNTAHSDDTVCSLSIKMWFLFIAFARSVSDK